MRLIASQLFHNRIEYDVLMIYVMEVIYKLSVKMQLKLVSRFYEIYLPNYRCQ
jgi:hypothetical protein